MIYIMKCTRSDITCAISKLSQFTFNLNQTHWRTEKSFEYLKVVKQIESPGQMK